MCCYAGRRKDNRSGVDDDADFVTDFADALAASGYRVFRAADAESACKLLSGPKRIDVVVVDLVLPDKSGLEVVHDTRRRNPEVKVLATTELQSQLHLDIAKYMGANVAIPKFPRSAIGHFPATQWIAQIKNLSRN